MSHVAKAPDGELEALGVMISHHFKGKRWKKTPTDDGFAILLYYPALRKGDVVPAYDYVYEVTDLSNGGNPARGSDWIDLKWVPPDKAPAGLVVTKESILLPLGGRAFLTNRYDVSAVRIDRPADKAPAGQDKPTARLELVFAPVSLPAVSDPRPRYAATVRPGDVVLTGGVGYKVRNIIPKDPKARVIGWVELDPQQIPKADLVRDKVRFVEPEAVDKKEPPKK